MPHAQSDETAGRQGSLSPPSISLPKGGGAIRGIGEKFGANPVTGTASLTVPLPVSPGRSGFGPQLSLSYDSGSGNGPFGIGWTLSLPSITRKTARGLPRYRDAEESDVFILSGAEDLVPVLSPDGRRFEDRDTAAGFTIHRYRPRIEGLFARIERWTGSAAGDVHWRSISRDNITTLYGKTAESRIADPADPARVFSWLICESYDDKGNAIVYAYRAEDDANVDRTEANERNRVRTAGRYLERVRYGNRISRLIEPDLTRTGWLFEVVFDYDDGHYEEVDLDPGRTDAEQHRFVRAAASPAGSWAVRPDPFSSYRAGFEVRTYRRCRRVLMFHRFAELGTEPCLVRSTELDYRDLDYSTPPAVDTELDHPGSTRIASFVTAVVQSGFVRDESRPAVMRNGVPFVTYLRKSLPPLELAYSDARIDDTVHELDAGSLENLPAGLDGPASQWADLDGEGLSGVLSEQAGAWFYKPNLGGGRLGPQQRIALRPSRAGLGDGRQRLLDLAGDGQLDLVAFAGPSAGFYERTHDAGWKPFQPFGHVPNISWDEPNLRFVDLNGDGHADVLLAEDDAFVWYPSLAEAGFGPAQHVRQPRDEERGPRLVLADRTQSIYVADMAGDGLSGLVRVRNGEVCYWPSLGYGRFGAKVTMDDAPWFDNPDQFEPARIRLADIDGSGVSDIIYLGRDGVRLYFNLSGNRWSGPRRLARFPPADDLVSIMTTDLLGNGTACLVWSSPLPGDSRRPLRYIDLMGGQKPHLLIRSANNFGAETIIHYTSSTTFYLADKLAGRPWITKIPFPVHVVERVETYDHISGNRFVKRSAYHHGYFDGVEREFRGFGLVEQWDTEEFAALGGSRRLPVGTNVAASSHVPPVLTRTWFHTGVSMGREHVSDFFAGLLNEQDPGEYYREPALTDAEARRLLLEDSALPEGLTVDEEREACRALKGSMLRQETYAADTSDREPHPYVVTEQSFTVRLVQPVGDNRHAVFLVHARESIGYHYERTLVPVLDGQVVDDLTAAANPGVEWRADPRVGHTLTLEVDAFGTVLKSATVGYGRRFSDRRLPSEPDRRRQTRTLVTYTETRVTNAVDLPDDHRTPAPCETRTYELTGYAPTGPAGRFQAGDLVQPAPGDHSRLTHVVDREISYEEEAGPGRERRLIEHVRTLYRRNDLTDLLALGALESLALPGENYELAFTPGLLAQVYRRPRDAGAGASSEDLLPDPASVLGARGADGGGYRLSQDLKAAGVFPGTDPDDHWWIPGGRVFLSSTSGDAPAQERAHARGHFFLPHRYRTPFHTGAAGTETVVTYDAYSLLMVETRDALGNVVTAATRDDTGHTAIRMDYRVLQPSWVTDPNGNRAAVAVDALGRVVGTAVMGKPGPGRVEGDSLVGFAADLTEAVVLARLADPLADPQAGLGRATTRLVYDMFAYRRTKHLDAPQPAVVYTMARETHDSEPVATGASKIQHSFAYWDGFGREVQKKIQAEAGRWVGRGWTVFNNKGKPVRQYEPFFTDTHRFEFDVRLGVSPLLLYDPVERVTAILHPDHTWEKMVFDPWRQETWDGSDTVGLDPHTDEDVKAYLVARDGTARLPAAEYLPTWYAARTDAAAAAARWPDPKTRAAERAAAQKAAVHARTPTVAHADPLGRTFLTAAHNRFRYGDTPPAGPPIETFDYTRSSIDIEGNQREVTDARGRIVVRSTYDMLGNRIHVASMDAGDRWMLTDVAGKPLYAWDSRGHRIHTAYDPLRRPTDTVLREGAGGERLVGRTVYGETRPTPEAGNLRGKVVEVFDQAGVMTTDAYDFKGNLLRRRRQLARAYAVTVDWGAAVPLEARSYTSRADYDAMSRPRELRAPDDSVMRLGYNTANLLERVEVNLRGAQENGEPVWTPLVTAIDYDARRRRRRIDHGNGVTTAYEYDPLTSRLAHLVTRRDAVVFPDDCPQPSPAGWPGCDVQNLHYTYDPVGNITSIRDDAQQTIYFRNTRVEPSADYTYDALHRLIEATGREHLGQVGAAPSPGSYDDAPRLGILLSASDGHAMARYLERYAYDAAGNVEEIVHRGTDPANPGWTRGFTYGDPSRLEPGRPGNRLTSTSIGARTETYSTAGDGYDAAGNMLRMPQLQRMHWNFNDQLQMTTRQAVDGADDEGGRRAGERTWYVYDAAGQRVRKVTELATGQVKDERIYAGELEIYRRHGATPLTRETLHVMDDRQRVAMVETRTEGVEAGVPAQRTRYQFDNHLGSASLELDDQARIISYEEYTPYGGTSYQAVRSQTETRKRYRFTGKERDEESGLYYHGARYFAPWLARWTSCDPQLEPDNGYAYCDGRPVVMADPDGKDGEFRAGISVGVQFGTHENRLYVQGDAFAAYRNHFVAETGLSVTTFPFATRWGLSRPGWETSVTLSGALGGEQPPAPSSTSTPTLPAKTDFRLVAGFATTWYAAKDMSDLTDPRSSFRNPGGLALTDQRLGIPFIRIDSGDNSFSASTRNDADILGGDSGDSFRTARVDLVYTRTVRTSTDVTDLQFGLTLDLVTGLLDRSRRLPVSNPEQYDMRQQPFGDLSQGALYFTFGVEHGSTAADRSFNSVGGHLSLGLDDELIRHATQNLLIHDILKVPHFPELDRPLRLYLDADLHTGAGALTPGVGTLTRPHPGD